MDLGAAKEVAIVLGAGAATFLTTWAANRRSKKTAGADLSKALDMATAKIAARIEDEMDRRLTRFEERTIEEVDRVVSRSEATFERRLTQTEQRVEGALQRLDNEVDRYRADTLKVAREMVAITRRIGILEAAPGGGSGGGGAAAPTHPRISAAPRDSDP